MKNLLLALVVLYLFYLADVFLADLLAFPEEVIGIHFLMIVLVIYSMGYLGLRQPAIFTQQDRSATQTDGQSMDAHANQNRCKPER